MLFPSSSIHSTSQVSRHTAGWQMVSTAAARHTTGTAEWWTTCGVKRGCVGTGRGNAGEDEESPQGRENPAPSTPWRGYRISTQKGPRRQGGGQPPVFPDSAGVMAAAPPGRGPAQPKGPPAPPGAGRPARAGASRKPHRCRPPRPRPPRQGGGQPQPPPGGQPRDAAAPAVEIVGRRQHHGHGPQKHGRARLRCGAGANHVRNAKDGSRNPGIGWFQRKTPSLQVPAYSRR